MSAGLARCRVVSTWNELFRPALTALDNPLIDRPSAEGGSTGPGSCVDAELVVSRAVAAGLHRLPTPPPPPGARRVLLACAEGEHHTLGVEALFAALVEQSVDARLLGPSVDDRVLSTAIATLRPAVVVVWAQVPATAAPTLIVARVTGPALVVAAGP
ncbi:MAG: MerR family transcriptional regulator, light-induced transcriptional regulator, partial [Pseudonocardiales bacterium]|nr:MerR family transcriptional regulator, light-induced transcriptional regulator [Pseudonocardiales bacterium]